MRTLFFRAGVFWAAILSSIVCVWIPLAHAQQTPQQSSPQAPVLVATVNIQNVTYVRMGNTFTISFDLTNGKIPQSQVRYAVLLVGKDAKGVQYVADQEVYPTMLSLGANTKTHKQVTYTAPSNMSGTYQLVLSSRTSSGLPLSTVPIGSVTLTATGGLSILANTCFLTIQSTGSTSTTRYNVLQGIDIASTESLVLHCSVNNAGAATTTAPTYETRYRTIFGDTVSQTGGDKAPISFPAHTTTTVVLVLPKALLPQAYDVLVSFPESNQLDVHYVIQGSSASIVSVSLDKNYYRAGDIAVASFVWGSEADTFPGSRHDNTLSASTTTPPANQQAAGQNTETGLTVTASLQDGTGVACAKPVSQPVLSGAARPSIDLSVTRACANPRLTLELRDPSGSVLASQTVTLQSSTTPAISRTAQFALAVGGVTVLLLLVLGGGLYIQKRHV